MPIVWVILHHEYRWSQCWRHEHSPYHRMLFAVFCHIRWRSFLFSHLIIHPVREWSGSQWQFWFCFVVLNDELLRSSLRANNGSPRSPLTTGCPDLSGIWIVFPRTETIRSHKSRAGIPSNLNPASKEMISDSVELCETEVCFLHIQLIGTNVCSQNAECSARSRFWILKISSKIGVLKQSQPALFCSITHIAILCVFTCVMNVWNQSIQAFVTGCGPFHNWSCKPNHWP